jgi:hypothetical protein
VVRVLATAAAVTTISMIRALARFVRRAAPGAPAAVLQKSKRVVGRSQNGARKRSQKATLSLLNRLAACVAQTVLELEHEGAARQTIERLLEPLRAHMVALGDDENGRLALHRPHP